MSEPNSERIITPMPKSLVEAIDDFRFTERMASRAEAIRTLIERGLGVCSTVEQNPAKDQALFKEPRSS